MFNLNLLVKSYEPAAVELLFFTPKIHGGLLGVRDDPEHMAAMTEHGIDEIDLVVVNLYPFEETVAQV